MNNQFNQVAAVKPSRSSFDRSHTHLTTFDAGKLIPVYVDECLPSDTHVIQPHVFARFATLMKPIFSSVYCRLHFFFVPNRILWEGWERLQGATDRAGIDPNANTYTAPYIVSTYTTAEEQEATESNTLWDYMGLPLDFIPDGLEDDKRLNYNALPFIAYRRIWNEFYRDQNLQDPISYDYLTESETIINYRYIHDLLPVAKMHDYFTSALPFAQKADPVLVPLTVDANQLLAPVLGLGFGVNSSQTDTLFYDPVNNPIGSMDTAGGVERLNILGTGSAAGVFPFTVSAKSGEGAYTYKPDINADLTAIGDTGGVGITVEAFRESVALQMAFELDARSGTRYFELLRARFDTYSPDSRLQRPEYIGGSIMSLNVNPVAQTSNTASTPQANLAAFATTADSGSKMVYHCQEHGYIMGFVSVVSPPVYHQGVRRMWNHLHRFDFAEPMFNNLGEQTILNREIFSASSADMNGVLYTGVFGYQSRYAEYRYFPNQLTGLMRPLTRGSQNQSLAVWHVAQTFSQPPSLSNQFIIEASDYARAESLPTEPDFIADLRFDVVSVRPMPVIPIPHLESKF